MSGSSETLKRLIPLVREMAQLRVVFKINVCFPYTERKTITRIHWDRRFGRLAVDTHAARSRLRVGCFLENAGGASLFGQFFHRTEDLEAMAEAAKEGR
jgi:hypothetical protein